MALNLHTLVTAVVKQLYCIYNMTLGWQPRSYMSAVFDTVSHISLWRDFLYIVASKVKPLIGYHHISQG